MMQRTGTSRFPSLKVAAVAVSVLCAASSSSCNGGRRSGVAPVSTGGSSVGGSSGSTLDPRGAAGAAVPCGGCQPNESCLLAEPGPRCVARSVRVPTGRAIDATEVTRGQYRAWLSGNPTSAGQAAVCAWNADFNPDAACMAKPAVCQGESCGAHPQPCVDQCDAAAYCKATGRRLCSVDEWTNNCSARAAYPANYGVKLVMRTCNDFTLAATTTSAVASHPGCQSPADSGFAGVFDLIGNVAEWVDDCMDSAGANDVCRPRGLSFGPGAAAPLCSQYTYAKRSEALDNLGFRCCAD